MTGTDTRDEAPVLSRSDLQAADPDGMYDHIRGFPEQLEEGRRRAEHIDPPCALERIDHLVFVGMGGSAIAGDLLAALAGPDASIPIDVQRSYALPGYVNDRSLVIVSSYSGNTEETLAGFDAADARDAKIFCISSNGRVLERARAEGRPFHELPGGMPPRAALGHSLTGVLQLAGVMGIAGRQPNWTEAVDLLTDMASELDDLAGNQALEIARALADRLPLVYSGNGLLSPVNLRWRCQFEENAERLAFGNVYPEWNHNEIMGWAGSDEWLYDRLGVITLRDAEDDPRITDRMAAVRDLIADRAGFWKEVTTRGSDPVTRMLSLIYLGDWTSLYLSVLTGANPMSIGLIQALKRRLAR